MWSLPIILAWAARAHPAETAQAKVDGADNSSSTSPPVILRIKDADQG